MNLIKPNPKIIPRFNIDYNTGDFLFAATHIKVEPDISSLNRIYDNSNISYTNSGRTSLYIILKALGLPGKSNIGVPLYCCPSVFDAILHAGHIPQFLDINPDNYTLSPEHLEKKIGELEAVIVIHTFGCPADLDEIRMIAADKPVIEDCAHAIFSTYKGKRAGTIATAGFFSFRTGKYLSAGEGGMITTSDLELALKIENEIEKIPKPSIINEIKHLIITYMRSTLYHRPWFGLISLPLGSRIENKVDLMNKYSFETLRIRTTDLHIITRKFIDFENKIKKQRINSEYLIDKLKHLDLQLPYEAQDTYCNYYLFAIQLRNEQERDKLSEKLLDKGVDTTKLFSKTPEIATQFYGYSGDCPNTEHVAKRILTIPNYYILDNVQLNKLSNIIINFYSTYV